MSIRFFTCFLLLLLAACNSSKDLLRHESPDTSNADAFESTEAEMETAGPVAQSDSTPVKPTKEIRFPIGLEPGNQAPNIVLPDPEGTEYALWDRAGKLVILDFWASWCAPCRANNATLSTLYNKYKHTRFTKGEGLTVFSVSFDKKREAWISAIERDGVPWPYHVSDLSGWESMVALDYDLRQLPTYFLLDQEGVVLERDVSITKLESVLLQYLK